MNAQARTVENVFEVQLKKLERLLAAANLEDLVIASPAREAKSADRWVASWRFCQH